jgi:putative SOS response-associated peptidase YedK
MCGRFTLVAGEEELQAQFEGIEFPTKFAPRYNIAPSQPVLAIPNDGTHTAGFFIWGLIPSWAKDPSIGNRLINARAETLAEKPSFRSSYKYKRCLLIADGFYEWKATPGTNTRVPYYVQMKDAKAFAFAGLWAEWRNADGSELRSCTIITTAPNELIAVIHNRMPAILRPQDREEWLEPSATAPAALEHMLQPYPAEMMRAFPVSTLVNNPATDRADCILPA